jgi:hypothetical protein
LALCAAPKNGKTKTLKNAAISVVRFFRFSVFRFFGSSARPGRTR